MTNLMQRIPFVRVLSRCALFRDDDRSRGFWMRSPQGASGDMPAIRIDYLSANEHGYTVRAEIPGARKEDVRVRVDGNRVSITAEVKRDQEEKSGDKILCSQSFRGSSYRSFTLDTNVDEDKAEARYDNGVLELTLPARLGRAGRELRVK